MRILIVAATGMEIAPVAAKLVTVLSSAAAFAELRRASPELASSNGERRRGLQSRAPATRYRSAAHDVDVLTTGVGMVATAAWCAHVLARERYNLALNLGVCGSFDPSLPPGAVVHVISDRIADLGAEDDETFLTAQEIGLVGEDEFPFHRGQLVNPGPPDNPALQRLPVVDGVTVNTVHGNDRSIAALRARFNPQVESMEGAAFAYACLIEGLTYTQVRAVSNVVEKRNRTAWKIADAVDILGQAALSILDHA